MTGHANRVSEAESRLAKIGIRARVETAGGRQEIAVIRLIEGKHGELMGKLRSRVVSEFRALGFQYVALELY